MDELARCEFCRDWSEEDLPWYMGIVTEGRLRKMAHALQEIYFLPALIEMPLQGARLAGAMDDAACISRIQSCRKSIAVALSVIDECLTSLNEPLVNPNPVIPNDALAKEKLRQERERLGPWALPDHLRHVEHLLPELAMPEVSSNG